ncbi:MAG: glycosyltransferase family 2 protein [Acetobacteraceae bacterium]|nr:glycosyltransferase family 2 protein [Acetobacteraceae bacterium]
MTAPPLTLSVIMPNRNHAALLPRALDALARQQRQADEILVIDDASTDDSRAVIAGFRERLPRLRLLENPERLGVEGSLNRGLREATGDLVYCGASDDATDPGLFATLMAALEANPRAALACAEARVITYTGVFKGYRPICRPGWHEAYLGPEETARLLGHMDHWILSVVAVYRRATLMAAGAMDDRLGAFSDSFLARQLALRDGFVFVPKVLGTWFVQEQSHSRATSRDSEMLHRLVAHARQRIEAGEGSIFPRGYGAVFDRRARFAAARLAVEEAKRDPNLVVALAGLTGPVGSILRAAAGLPGPVGRIASLAVLTISLRPMSLTRLLATALRRSGNGGGARVPG